MKRGILYVVFGEEYDKLAAHTIKYSRQFTDLPICVLTNMKERNELWDDMDVEFVEFDLEQKDNRQIKTTMIDYTPFEQTLYLDCDSVIRKRGIEKLFNKLKNHDMFLHHYLLWKRGGKVVQGFKDAFLKYKVDMPINIYNGALIGFKKNKNTIEFFNKWNEYWIGMDRKREMHVLACAIKNTKLKLYKYFKKDKIFSPNIPADVIVQHNYNSYKGKDWFIEYNMPRIVEFKPFDSAESVVDWHWVEYQ